MILGTQWTHLNLYLSKIVQEYTIRFISHSRKLKAAILPKMNHLTVIETRVKLCLCPDSQILPSKSLALSMALLFPYEQDESSQDSLSLRGRTQRRELRAVFVGKGKSDPPEAQESQVCSTVCLWICFFFTLNWYRKGLSVFKSSLFRYFSSPTSKPTANHWSFPTEIHG